MSSEMIENKAELKPMLAPEFERALAQLGTDNAEIADIMGVNIRAPQRWAVQEPPVPPLAAGVIRLLLAGVIRPRQLWQAVRGKRITR